MLKGEHVSLLGTELLFSEAATAGSSSGVNAGESPSALRGARFCASEGQPLSVRRRGAIPRASTGKEDPSTPREHGATNPLQRGRTQTQSYVVKRGGCGDADREDSQPRKESQDTNGACDERQCGAFAAGAWPWGRTKTGFERWEAPSIVVSIEDTRRRSGRGRNPGG